MANNNTKHLFAWLGLTLALVVSVTAYRRPMRPCSLKCSNVEDVVWATDGKKCFVRRNVCQLRKENCLHQNRCQNALRVVEKNDCQKLCISKFTKEFDPVCAEYNGNNRTFQNAYILDFYICTTGQTYNFIREGFCKSTNFSSFGNI
ncbi:uncharacterized protein [Eurosta solidaginis]|uniref:uncharacterized protein n=1 Tax=Eurosta solidaginis TaxID=178769 RepID=UPI0035313417